MPLSVTASAGGTVEIDGPIVDGSGVGGSTDSLTKVGLGTLILTNSTNGFEGGLNVEAGTVVITTTGACRTAQPLPSGAGGTFVFDPSAVPSGADNNVAASAGGVAAVPEPSTLALLAAGVLLIAFRTSRKVKN